jgi:transcriptional regulator with XRE-family HTH domain
MVDTERYGAGNLRAVLHQQGRRQDWLSRQIGVSEALISKVLKGERTLSRAHAERVAAALNVPFFMIFELRERSEVDACEETHAAD